MTSFLMDKTDTTSIGHTVKCAVKGCNNRVMARSYYSGKNSRCFKHRRLLRKLKEEDIRLLSMTKEDL